MSEHTYMAAGGGRAAEGSAGPRQKFEAVLDISRSSINRTVTIIKLLDKMPYLWKDRLIVITDDRKLYDSEGGAESYVFSDAGEGAEIKYTAEELIIYIRPIEGEGDV